MWEWSLECNANLERPWMIGMGRQLVFLSNTHPHTHKIYTHVHRKYSYIVKHRPLIPLSFLLSKWLIVLTKDWNEELNLRSPGILPTCNWDSICSTETRTINGHVHNKRGKTSVLKFRYRIKYVNAFISARLSLYSCLSVVWFVSDLSSCYSSYFLTKQVMPFGLEVSTLFKNMQHI